MAEFKAIKKSVSMSPRKTRLVADLVRGKKVGTAIGILKNVESPRGEVILKVLNSAVANANYANENKDANVNLDDLFVKEIYVNEGTMLKRMHPRAKGSGYRILKRTCHITVVVADGK